MSRYTIVVDRLSDWKDSREGLKLMPVDGCKQMLDGQKKAAEAQGKSCD